MIAEELAVVDSPGFDAADRTELRRLWHRAFGGRFGGDDADHCYGGVHVVARDGAGVLVAHASVVPRRIRFADRPWLVVGYVEGVAVAPDRQGTGLGRRVMERLHDEIAARHAVAMLSTGRATGFYERLGWERWQGLSYTWTAQGVVADDEHGGLMVRRVDATAVPDLTADVTCEDRSGDAW